MKLTSGTTDSKAEQDAKILKRAQRRLRRAFRDLKSWRKVAVERGVNHGHISLVMQGKVPPSWRIRKALGFPRVMPSERRGYVRRVYPLIGSEGWESVYLRRLKPRRRKP